MTTRRIRIDDVDGATNEYVMGDTTWIDPERYCENAGALVFEAGAFTVAIPWHRIRRVEFIGWDR